MAIRAADLEVRVTADTSQAQSELSGLNAAFQGTLVGNKIQDLGGGILDFVGDFVTVGADFEEQMTVIDQIIGGTVSHIEELKKVALAADIKTMFNAPEVALGMEMLARAGFTATQIEGEMLDGLLYFAAATDTEMSSAGRSFGAAMRIWENTGMTGIEVADLLTAAVLRSGKSADQFMTAFQYVGSIANQFGTTPEDLVTTIALMEQLGIRSMTVGTGLRSMYTAFAGKRGDIEALGIDLYDVNDAGQEVLKTLPDIYEQFHTLIKSMSADDALNMLTDLFGKPAASPLMTLFTTGFENWDRMTASMDSVGSSEDMMNARMNTLKGSIEILSATWLGFKKTLGDSVSGYIKPVIDALSQLVNWMQNLPESVLKVIALVIAFGGVLLTITGSLIIFNALLGTAGLVSIFGLLVTTAAPLIAALGLISLAIIALNSNFGGVTDKFKGLLGIWDDFKERYEEGMDKEDIHINEPGDGPMGTVDKNRSSGFYASATNALAALRDMGGPDLLHNFKEAADGVDVIHRSLTRLSNVIKKHGLAEGLRQLFSGDIGKDMLKGVGDIVSEFPRAIGSFLRDFDTGSKRVNNILKNLGSAFLLFGTAIEAVFDGDFSKAGDAIQRMFDRLGTVAVQLKGVVIDILTWAFKSDTGPYERLKNWIMGAITGERTHVNEAGDGPMGTTTQKTGFTLSEVLITIGSWAIDASGAGDLFDKIWNEYINPSFTESDVATADRYGEASGRKIGSALVSGFRKGLEALFGLGSASADIAGNDGEKTGKDVAGPFIRGFLRGFNDEVDKAMTAWLGNPSDAFGRLNDWIDKKMTAWLGDPSTAAQRANDNLDLWLTGMFGTPSEALGSINDRLDKWLTNRLGKPSDAPGTLNEKIDRWMTAWLGKPSDAPGRMNDKIDEWMTAWLGDPSTAPTRINDKIDLWMTNWLGNPSDAPGKINDKIDVWMTDWLGDPSDAPQSFNDTVDAWMTGWLGEPEDIDFSGAFTSVGNGITGAWNGMIDGLAATLHVPGWAVKLATGDYLGAIRDLFGGGGGDDGPDVPKADPDTYPNASDLSTEYDKIWNTIKNGPQPVPVAAPTPPDTGPTPGATPTYFVQPQQNATSAIAAAGSALSDAADTGAQTIETFNKDVTTGLQNIARNFLTFGAGIPVAMTPFVSAMAVAGTTGTQGFAVAVGAGMIVAAAAARLGAQMVAINAQVPSLYNHGFAVGQSLGSGLAAGIISTIGAVAAARDALNATANGSNARNNGFSSSGSSNPVPPKQPTVVQQTNHVNIDPKNVQEFFSTANFVSNLDRDRQIVLGRA